MQQKKWFVVMSLLVLLTFVTGIVPALAAPRQQSGTVHVVQAGDTLYSIARRYGVTVDAIAAANGIVNPSLIYVGQRLVIPTGGRLSTGSATTGGTGTVHVVQSGETLTRIALRYGVSIWAIAQANNLANVNYIYAGQRLIIPGTQPGTQPTPTPTPVRLTISEPTSFPGPWNGEYFDNVSLSGTAYLTRSDAAINFNWDYGSPAGGMPTNNFSVRWTGTFAFSAGVYRFYAKVDDGVRLYVDDVCIINGWVDGSLRLYTFNQGLTAGNHTVKVEYYDRTQAARIHVWWQPVTGPTSTPGVSAATATPAPAGAGWFAQFYNNKDLSGTPVLTRYDPWIGFDWGADSPAPGVWSDGFSARWTQKVHLNTDHYRFCARSDDGVRIWVGDTLVLDEWHANPAISFCGVHWAATGDYDVKVEYYEDGGSALIYVWWEPY